MRVHPEKVTCNNAEVEQDLPTTLPAMLQATFQRWTQSAIESLRAIFPPNVEPHVWTFDIHCTRPYTTKKILL